MRLSQTLLIVCLAFIAMMTFLNVADAKKKRSAVIYDKLKEPVKVNCPPGKSLLYRFRATTLVGNRGLISSNRGHAGNMETQFSGRVILTCPSSSTNEKALDIVGSQKEKNVVLVSFLHATFAQYQGRSRGLSSRKYRKVVVRKDITEDLNKNPMVFIQSKSGHIQTLLFRQSETRYNRGLKKGILRLLTTETKKKARNQTDGFGGKYYKNYQRKSRRGKTSRTKRTLSVYQTFDQDDFVTAFPVDKRQLHYHGSHMVRVAIKSGIIRRAGLKLKVTFGPSKDVPKHYAFTEFEKLTKKSKKEKEPEQNSSSELETLFVGSIVLEQAKPTEKAGVNIDQSVSQVIFDLERNGRNAQLGSEFAFENSFSINKLDRKSMNQLNRRQFSMKYFRRLLNGCKADPTLSKESNHLLAAVAKYSKLHPIKSSKVLLNELSRGTKQLNNDKLSDQDMFALQRYLESVQTLAASIKSARVQDKLVQLSSKHPHLANNYIYASIVIAYPTQAAFSLLKTLKSKGVRAFVVDSGMRMNITKEFNDDVKANAFMAYADLASRLRDVKLQRHIVKEIVTRIAKSSSLTELTTNFHALNNAGRAVQVELLYAFIADDRVPDAIKILIVENLKKRLRDETQVDDMIHSLLSSTGYTPVVKASLINAQTEREKHLKKGSSTKQFAYFHKKFKNEEIRSAIKDYLYTCGSQQCGDELARAMRLKKKSQKQVRPKRKSTRVGLVGRSLLSSEDMELLETFENVEQNTLFFRRLARAFRRVGSHFRRIGSRIRSHFRRIGARLRGIGRKIGGALRRVAKGIAKVAKKVAKGVMKAVNWLKEKIEAALNAVKKIIAKIKYYFSAAKFENQQACMPANKKGEQLCLYNTDMVNFVRKQGDLSTIDKSKQFVFEKLLGTNAVNMYTGFLVYAGASFQCSAEKTGFDFVLFARAEMTAKLFKKQLTVVAASAEFSKRPDDPVNDNVYVKVFQTVFINKQFVPEKIRKFLELCFSETKPLIEKRFPKLVDLNYQFQIGPVPITFNFNVALNMGVELRYGLCISKLEASTSVEPYVSLSVTGSAAVGIPVAKAGIYLKATITYRIVPRLAFEHCNLCASLQHKLEGITFDVGMTVKLFTFKKEWKFFRQQTKGYVKTLFEKCIGAGGYKPSDNDNTKLTFTSQKSSDSTDQQTPQDASGYQDTPVEPSGPVANHEELTNIAEQKGLGTWAKKTSGYKPLFGPNAQNIPLTGLKPQEPSRQALHAPVTQQEDKVWSTEFLKEHVPQKVLESIDIEKLRRLPLAYFQLKMEDREKLPNDVLLLSPADFDKFIQHLPGRYMKDTSIVLPPYAYTKVWSSEVLQKRLPANVFKNVPIQYLRHLPEEILQISKRVLGEVPYATYKQGEGAIVGWICAKYNHLCARLKKLFKADGTSINIVSPQANNNTSKKPDHVESGPAAGRSRRRRRIYIDLNVNVNNKAQNKPTTIQV